MSNHSSKRKLVLRIMAWVMSILMVGSAIAAAITMILHLHG